MATAIFEDENADKLLLDVPKEKRHLNTTSYDYSVEFLVSMMHDNKIVLEVPFQRQYIWKDDKASQLIESIIMNVPIPPIYFAEEDDGKWLVVDGLQRLNSLLRFFENEYGLKKLEILKELDKLKFRDLPPKAKSLLANGQLRINVIRKDSHPDIKYDIFMRLNKGAVTLNYQELRNCLYRGALNNVARSIVESNKQFLEILNLEKPHNRFLDVEFIIRFFALFKNLTLDENGNYCIKDYKGRMVTYINLFMENNRNLQQSEILEYETLFNGIIDKVVVVFGTENAFRDISTSKKTVNKSLADCIMLSFSKYQIEKLQSKRSVILDVLSSLLTNDNRFKDSISQRTSDTDILNYRIDKWIKCLDNAL